MDKKDEAGEQTGWRVWPYKRLDRDEVPSPGAHLVTRRTGYTHHGIYVGDATVIHYSGLADGWNSGPIEATGLDAFAGGAAMWVRLHPNSPFKPREVSERARSRLGEEAYCMGTNNCEHFAWWCAMGDHASPQVDWVMMGTTGFWAWATGAAATVGVGAFGVVQGVSAPGIMSGLKVLGMGGGAAAGLAVLPTVVGAGTSILVGATILREREGMSEDEKQARLAGRIASHVASTAVAAGGVYTIGAVGAVSGFGAAGLSSGLAAVGAVVGGGMLAGTVVVMAAPAVAAVGIGYGAYRLFQQFNGPDRSRGDGEG